MMKSAMLDSWKPGTDCCKWSGISCRPESNNRFTGLYLYGWASEGKNILSGPVSLSLSKLQYLESFLLMDLGNLTCTFHDFLFAIPNIRTILITNSKLSGCIPRNIGNLTTLESLILAGNRFSGRIPSLAKLTRLVQLDLNVGFRSKQLPVPEEAFYVGFKLVYELTGNIPDICFQDSSFLKLNLSWNHLYGAVPRSFDPVLHFLAMIVCVELHSHRAKFKHDWLC